LIGLKRLYVVAHPLPGGDSAVHHQAARQWSEVDHDSANLQKIAQPTKSRKCVLKCVMRDKRVKILPNCYKYAFLFGKLKFCLLICRIITSELYCIAIGEKR
jgi:hypothetical protein